MIMQNKMRHFLSLITACVVTAVSIATFPADAVGNIDVNAVVTEQNVGLSSNENFIYHIEEPCSTENFEVRQLEDDEGKFTFDVHKTFFTFDCSWENTLLVDFEAGLHNEADLDELKRYCLNYAASAETEGGYIFQARLTGELKQGGMAEIYIAESYSDMDIPTDNKINSITVNDADYDVYYFTPDQNTDASFLIVRKQSIDLSKQISGTIDIKGICEQLDIHKITGTKLCVRALGPNGTFKISKNNIVAIDNPIIMNVPNCDNNNEYVYYDGLRYSFWQLDDYSNGEMTVNGDGKAVCVYDNTSEYSDCLFRKGFLDENILNDPNALKGREYDKVNISYETTIKAKDNYAVGVYGWTHNQNAEFYVVQFRNSDDFIANKEYVDTVEIDGVKYDLYKGYAVPLAFDAPTVYQYWSVSQLKLEDKENEAVGEVDLLKHFEVWEKAGFYLGKLYQVTSFAEVFGEGAGEIILGNVDIDIESPNDKEDVLLGGKGMVKYERDGYSYSAQYGVSQSILKKDDTIVFNYDSENLSSDYISKVKTIDNNTTINLEKKDNVCIGYNADVSTECDYFITGHAWMKKVGDYKNIHLQVIDCASTPYVLSQVKKIGETKIDEKWYDLYVKMNHILPHTIHGDDYVDEYYSICRNSDKNHTNVYGYIDLAAHAKAFKEAGYDLGFVRQASLDIDMTGRGKGILSLRFSKIDVTEAKPETFTEDDVELYKSFLLGEECEFGDRDFDINNDGKWDVYDLIELRKAVSAKIAE